VPQQVEIDEAFRIRRENELPRVAALCHMVRGVQSDDACESSHEQKVPQSHETGNAPSVPVFPGRGFRIKAGAIEYRPEPLEQPAEGNVLICCSRPQGDIEINL